MNFFTLNINEIIIFLSVLVRVSCILLVVPLFSSSTIPPTIKILFSFSIAAVFFPLAMQQIPAGQVHNFATAGSIFSIGMKEALVGFVLGFSARLIFDSLSFGFSYMGMQMGFGFSSLYDPNAQVQAPIISNFVMTVSTLVFIVLDGHHLILRAILDTFTIVPLGMGTVTKEVAAYAMETGGRLFWIAVRVAAPIAATMFLMNIGFGVISRAVPQINVLLISFIINILVGLIVFVMMFPILGENVHLVMNEMFERFIGMARYLNG